jgi:hypothetical protein
VAVDRAVLLPHELTIQKEKAEAEQQRSQGTGPRPSGERNRTLFGGNELKRTVSPDRLSELNIGSSRPQNFDGMLP